MYVRIEVRGPIGDGTMVFHRVLGQADGFGVDKLAKLERCQQARFLRPPPRGLFRQFCLLDIDTGRLYGPWTP
jgi:hypothetical protein